MYNYSKRRLGGRILLVFIIVIQLVLIDIELELNRVKNFNYSPGCYPLSSTDPVILINSNADALSLSLPGIGSFESPFLIENKNIVASSTAGIHIQSTTFYFIIRNCTIINGIYGILLQNVALGTVTAYNNTIYGTTGSSNSYTGFGIYISSSHNMTISNNTLHDITGGTAAVGGNGIGLINSNNCNISNNIIYHPRPGSSSNNCGNGIWILTSNYNIFSNNQIYDTTASGTTKPMAANGFTFSGSNGNLISNNIIHDITGSNSAYSGNGIYIEEYYTDSDSNQILNNIIYDITGGGAEYTGNGIALRANTYYPEDQITNTAINGNNIHDVITEYEYWRSGNGILVWDADSIEINDNTIANCSGYSRAGCGILTYYVENSEFTDNIIDNCDGDVFAGIGIFNIYGYNVDILRNEIYNIVANVGGSCSGNGIMFYDTTFCSIKNNNIINATKLNSDGFSGFGIYLEYDCDNNVIANNNITSQQGNGILFTKDFDNNMVKYNNLGTANILNRWKDATYDNSNNVYRGNIAQSIYVYTGSNNYIEDNTVYGITVDKCYDCCIVGNLKPTGDSPSLSYIVCTEADQYFLKVITPKSGSTYNGIGGIDLDYKYQYKGYDLSWLKYSLSGVVDYVPRPFGELFLPWKTDGSATITLYANDTHDSSFSYESPQISFSYHNIGSTGLLDIVRNEQQGGSGDPQALSYHSSSGSGTLIDPYIIENKHIIIPQEEPPSTPGISIENTDAYFILKDSVIVGGMGDYGISLKNVKNAYLENVTIIGLPHTYSSGDISEDSAPIERGIYLDSNCANNTIYNCIVYRTSSSAIRVEGDHNQFYNNIIANAYGYGFSIYGDSNSLLYNEIGSFGGPDYNNYYYNKGNSDDMLFGINIGDSGSSNLIESNKIMMYPESGIKVSSLSNCENIIVDNEFDDCITNITDSGTDTYLIKITTPSNGSMFTANTPLEAYGYYPGIDGFLDIDDGEFPEDWSKVGNGNGYSSEVISEKTDIDDIKHKKVLYMYSGEGIYPEINVSRSFDDEIQSGTVEFWVLKKGDIEGTANFSFTASNGILFEIMLYGGNFYFLDGGIYNNTEISFEDDTWYRISVDFSENGGYEGLAAHQYKFKIYNSSGSDILYESLNSNFALNNNCSGLTITATGGASSNMSIYGDAFGYSWNSGYSVGDNKHEGMKITNLIQSGFKDWDWIGYSLNGYPPIELSSFGTIIIPLPNSLGLQNIQLFINDSADYQSKSPLAHFTYNFDRRLNLLSLYENGILAVENTLPTNEELIKMEPVIDLNITISFNTERLGTATNTNASIFYRINQGSWICPFTTGSHLGTYTYSFIIDSASYELGDTLEYYIGFQQYESGGDFLQQYYWTSMGLCYFEVEAQSHSILKKVSPIPYQLTLDYSVFYQAEREEDVPTDIEGYNITMKGLAPVAMANFSLSYYNITDTMDVFNVTFDNFVSSLTHKMYVDNSFIFNTENEVINEEEGINSPFILPYGLTLIESFTNISIPIMLFESVYGDPDNSLEFTGEILNFTYIGEKNDWFYGHRTLQEFKIYTGDLSATIRYDALTGIMVYYNYDDLREGQMKHIYFGLIENNQSYDINVKLEMREELEDTTQDFVNATLDGILYDPPGDHSYSQISSGTSITTGWNLVVETGEQIIDENRWFILGFGKETDEYSIDTSSTEYSFELTHTYQEILTSSIDSEHPELIGHGGGDLYFGSGIYILYSFYANNYYIVVNESDPANYNYNDIRVFKAGSKIEYIITPNTSFSVLGAYLDDSGLNELENENIFINNEISGSEEYYVEELQNSPYFWTPSSIYEFGNSTSTSKMSSISSYMEFSNDTYFTYSKYIALSAGGSAGLGVEIAWAITTEIASASGRFAALNVWSREMCEFTTTNQENSILVHLEDDDGAPIGQNDQFKIRIFNDNRYNTIGFIIDSDATYTSRPHEYFTGDRRCPTTCKLLNLENFLHGDVTLSAIAIDEEINDDEVNNIFKVNFYFDDDPVFGLDSVYIGTHGEPEKTGVDDPELFQVIWDVSALQGKYYVFAVAYDYGIPMSNTLLSSPIEVQIDNNAPIFCQINIYEPFNGAIDLYALAQDLETDILYIEYWDGDPKQPGSKFLGRSDISANSYKFVWATDPDGKNDGIHLIYARAYDMAGNYFDSEPIEINVDNGPLGKYENQGLFLFGVAALGSLATITTLSLIKSIPNLKSKLKHVFPNRNIQSVTETNTEKINDLSSEK